MLTTLTEQDVSDALFAFSTKNLARVEGCSPESLIRSLEIYDGQSAGQIEQYRRGLAVLKNYIVLTSERSVVGGRFDAETADRIVSPIISVSSGHIATSEAYRSVGLAQR